MRPVHEAAAFRPAYEELLGAFRLFRPIPILLEGSRGYHFSVDELRKEILGRGLSALLLSNPCNPTGRTLAGSELAAWVATCRSLECALLVDEFYSHSIWTKPDGETVPIVSAAAFVEDVDKDPAILFGGLTKNWCYPGMRIFWTVGPKKVIEAVASAGSFLDGGGSRPAQKAAVSLLEDEVIDAETSAIRRAFLPKRSFLIQRLRELGIRIELEPEGGFYVWGSIEGLPAGLSDDMGFFERALERKVICVPGRFFDKNLAGGGTGERRASAATCAFPSGRLWPASRRPPGGSKR